MFHAGDKAEPSPARLRRPPRGRVVLSAHGGRVAWAPERELEHPQWVAAGYRIGAIGRGSQWWVGDWLRYGASKWGEKYPEAARITGYDCPTLRNMAWVASRFPVSLRSDKLTWSHHVLLAPLTQAEQRYWIDRATAQHLSVADLRIELRSARRVQARVRRDRTPPDAGDTQVACPNCGHAIPLAALRAQLSRSGERQLGSAPDRLAGLADTPPRRGSASRIGHAENRDRAGRDALTPRLRRETG
jgi:hypothetical protein